MTSRQPQRHDVRILFHFLPDGRPFHASIALLRFSSQGVPTLARREHFPLDGEHGPDALFEALREWIVSAGHQRP